MPDEGVSRRRAGGRLMRDEKDNEKKKYRRIQSKRLQRQIMLQGYSCMQSGCQVSEPDLFQSNYVLLPRLVVLLPVGGCTTTVCAVLAQQYSKKMRRHRVFKKCSRLL